MTFIFVLSKFKGQKKNKKPMDDTLNKHNTNQSLEKLNIQSFLMNFDNWLDSQDFGDISEIRKYYLDNAKITTPRGSIEGIEELKEYLHSNNDPLKSQHCTLNFLVNKDEEKFIVTTNSVVYYYNPERQLVKTGGLKNEFKILNTKEGLRISELKIDLQWLKNENEF
jgi:hypothetical protein